MKKAVLYFALGTIVSFLINYFFTDTQDRGLEVYYALSFGIAWGLAYYLDSGDFSLLQKMSFSFLAMIALVVVGILIFNLELAIPSILKFSTVFVAYYFIASFRSNRATRK
ncbi:hypothetical protein ASG31_17960 [Chryseobacterium sp. Leaf404]|uniref:hypothetical protein n=1 Tax=unclassified Chryseobacterium TaxID=2593645 RepID=UPI0006FFF29E|nr:MULTISPECIES: hypothetical protein [unclassified Chryseobacterium]KQT19264.1 hypothetical protein ASG31_17960 [Chryseobacterium sp. Leaf404]